MAKNTNSVTALHGDNAKGPVYYNPDLTVEVTADTDYSAAGWLQLGYGSTDGISIAQTADDTSKDVWGASLGTVYSNFADVVTLHMASFYDEDVAKVIYGAENVIVDDDNVVHVKVKARQGSKGTFVINARNDNGDAIQHIYRGQTDPNFSIDAAEGDIITFDLPVKGISAADGTTSEFSFPKAGNDAALGS